MSAILDHTIMFVINLNVNGLYFIICVYMYISMLISATYIKQIIIYSREDLILVQQRLQLNQLSILAAAEVLHNPHLISPDHLRYVLNCITFLSNYIPKFSYCNYIDRKVAVVIIKIYFLLFFSIFLSFSK